MSGRLGPGKGARSGFIGTEDIGACDTAGPEVTTDDGVTGGMVVCDEFPVKQHKLHSLFL